MMSSSEEEEKELNPAQRVANQRRLGVLRKQTMKKQLKEEEKGLTKFLF